MKALSPALFGITLLSFFLTFVTYVSNSGKSLATLSGLESSFAKVIEYRKGIDLPGDYIIGEGFAFIAFTVSVVGLVVGLVEAGSDRKPILSLLAACVIFASLIALKYSQNYYVGIAQLPVVVQFQTGYWISWMSQGGIILSSLYTLALMTKGRLRSVLCTGCGGEYRAGTAKCLSCGLPLEPAVGLANQPGAVIKTGQAQAGTSHKRVRRVRKTPFILSHWPQLISGLQASSQQFYADTEQALARRCIPNTEIFRVEWSENGVLSAQREYLRVARGKYAFDICGAPFGNGFFVSNWCIEERSSLRPWEIGVGILLWVFVAGITIQVLGSTIGNAAVLIGSPLALVVIASYLNRTREGWDDFLVAIPLLGRAYERLFRPQTYYKIDTAEMFRQAVHGAVLEVVNGMLEAKGLRKLSETDTKPMLKIATGKI